MTANLELRASSLGNFADCMARGLASSLRDLVVGAGYQIRGRTEHISALVGTGAHAAISADLVAIKDGINRPSPQDLEELGIVKFRGAIRDAEAPISMDDTTPDTNRGEKQIREISAVHRAQVAGSSRPVAVEERMWAALGVGGGVLLSGQPDSLEDLRPGGLTVRDLKTGRRSNYLHQLGAYSLLAEANGLTITDAEIVGIPRAKAGTIPEAYGEITPGGVIQYGAIPAVFSLVEEITRAVDRVNAGDPVYQVNPGSALCSVRFCPAHGTRFCIATWRGAGGA